MGRHGGYGRQAQRRGEQFVACLGCGQRAHVRIQPEPEDEKREGFLAPFLTLVLIGFAGYALILAVASMEVALT